MSNALAIIGNKNLIVDGARFDVTGNFDGEKFVMAIDDDKLTEVLEVHLSLATDSEGKKHPMLEVVNQKRHTTGLRTRDFLSFFKVKSFTFQVEVES